MVGSSSPGAPLRSRAVSVTGVGVAAAVLLSACGGSSTAGQATSSGTAPTTQGVGGSSAQGQQRPGVTGLLAAISGHTLQVQGSGTQTAVTYSGKTAFEEIVKAARSDVTVGTCVSARVASQGGAPGSATTGVANAAFPATPAATGASATTATQVAVSKPVAGRCSAAGFTGFPGGRGGRATAPSGAPTASGAPSGRSGVPGRGFGGRVFGLVKAVSADTITVSSTLPARFGTSSPSQGQARTVVVSTSSATAYTQTEAVTPAALRVGLCVTALGAADNTGALAAKAISLRPSVNGSCRQPGGRLRPLGGSGNNG